MVFFHTYGFRDSEYPEEKGEHFLILSVGCTCNYGLDLLYRPCHVLETDLIHFDLFLRSYSGNVMASNIFCIHYLQ